MYLSSIRFFSLLLLLFLFTKETAQAKERTLRWGKLSEEEKALQSVSYDKEAHAVVLGTTGRLVYQGDMFVIEKHVRIKILDAEGTNEGNVVIPFYAKDRFENIERIKGQTLEILPDGKVIKHKLEKSQIFEATLDDKWKEMRFALPAVKPGSIIEYAYTFTTRNFAFLDGWIFQAGIPTLYSSFKAEIPSSLQYYHLLQGPKLYKKYKDNKDANEWVLENLPALKKESYTYNLLDHAERVRFQLHSYRERNGLYKEVFSDWQSISKEVLSNSLYRNYLKRNKDVDELLTPLIKGETDQGRQLEKIYSYVQETYSWNAHYGLIPDRQLKDFLQEKKANGAAINLLLLSLLQKAGFDAYPALLSTKSHGKVNPNHSMLDQFNHTICIVKFQNKQIALDAAGTSLPPGILPEEDLNHTALMLSEESTDWHTIKDEAKSSTLISYSGDLPGGTHKFEYRWMGYDAERAAKELQGNGLPALFSFLDFSFQTDSVNMQKALRGENSLTATFYLSEKEPADYSADRIYYSPAVPQFLKENPFIAEERNFPVDFGHTSKKYLSYNIALPEGFQLEEKPESILLKTPDNQASFTYQAGILNGNLAISVLLEIKDPFFTLNQYPNLREFYSQVINHCQKPLVLVRTGDKN